MLLAYQAGAQSGLSAAEAWKNPLGDAVHSKLKPMIAQRRMMQIFIIR
jgi:hypothetical protein